MKKIFVCLALSASVLMVSCSKKDEVKPTNAPAVVTTINVEYRIVSASGLVGVDYIAPNAAGTLELMHMDVNRTEQTISFSYNSGYGFSVSAYNLNPSHDVVQVEIYVNGVLKTSASSTNPSQPAVAKGNF
ncbi:hypothetical protein BH10BAC1_BH10BAC1_08830 [soil metagenome]